MNECVFSDCRRYRYALEHVIVTVPLPRRIMWIGLNPSTADEQKLDPTLRRIRRFSADWGFTSFVMTNLFAFRATDPRVMMQAADPVGVGNMLHLLSTARKSSTVVAAWGASGNHAGRADFVVAQLGAAGIHLHCLGLTRNGSPRHPLYVSASTELQPFGISEGPR